ncbi:hypothetical protein PAA8504_03063 [Palleronia abyssalis]|uniref:Uncharacterized protein n=1 Tax=Palleronia abyssalis TaxID=1501240 RepID=A0A2R8BYK7_9RHOB|nr:hypothetical protein PAA8504_03063 [Palleronia abyssalis]
MRSGRYIVTAAQAVSEHAMGRAEIDGSILTRKGYYATLIG